MWTELCPLGNIGVIKSMVVELVSSDNLAQAYAYMPIAWSAGGTLGSVLAHHRALSFPHPVSSPIIGGVLSHPADRFPKLFGDSAFLRAYPYFLPCAVPATFSIIVWLVTLFFLREVHHILTQWG
jgi:hypothetical protein